MDPFIHSYAKYVHESLAELPRESQQLATRVRESDVQVTNLLSALETDSGRLECSELVALSARLNEGYKSKFERVADLLRLLDQSLATLESSRNDVISALGDPEGAVRAQEAKLDIYLATNATADSPRTAVSRRRRKQARHEIVRNRGVRQVQDSYRGAAMDTPTESPLPAPASAMGTVCICLQPPAGEMVECKNEECSVGRYHLACARLKSIPSGTWFCHGCIKRVQ